MTKTNNRGPIIYYSPYIKIIQNYADNGTILFRIMTPLSFSTPPFNNLRRNLLVYR